MKKLYEGKAKIIYTTEDPEILLTQFKDDITAFNSSKRGIIPRKGEINCQISSALFKWLESKNIATHFIDQPTHREMRVRAVKIVPIEVVVRNIAAGSLCQQTGLIEGKILSFPLVEFYLKNDELGDPLLTHDRLLLMELASQKQLEQLKSIALKINQYLIEFFASCHITLVDFKLEFGLDPQGNLLLADEISPDTCRLWDQQTKNVRDRVLDKDRFRHDLGEVEAGYQQVQQRVLEKLGIK